MLGWVQVEPHPSEDIMDLTFLNQADSATLQLEQARRALESAKLELDSAKKNYDEVLAQADEHGIPKAKLKKLAEDRVAQLIESGLFEGAPAPRTAAPAKPKVKKAKASPKAADDDVDPAEAWVARQEPHELEPDDEVAATT